MLKRTQYLLFDPLCKKEGNYKRINQLGDREGQLVLKNVNGDGMDDVIAISSSRAQFRAFLTALSDGIIFINSHLAITQILSVFRMDGILQFSKKITDSVQYISLVKGACIVKLDEGTTKVISKY